MTRVEQDEFLQNTLYLSLPKGIFLASIGHVKVSKMLKRATSIFFAGGVG